MTNASHPVSRQDPAARAQAERPTDETVKETLEAIVIAFILAFVFRAYVVEAFVIPTGSMAPTLLGEHVDITCAQCGYRFAVDSPSTEEWRNQIAPLTAACPMCAFPNPLPRAFRPSAGDRILVHKFLYSIAEPRRWDVVVFKNPQDPSVNFIKRLVGLPDESVWIIDGNIYVQSHDQDWHIAHKTDRPSVQRDVWQPIYHSSYIPLDHGRPGAPRSGHGWRTPWEATEPDDWDIEGLRSFRHMTDQADEIRFVFLPPGPNTGWYPYNEFRNPTLSEPIEDVRIAATFQPDRAGLSVELRTTARLDSVTGNPQVLTAKIDSQGHALLERQDNDGSDAEVIKRGQTTPFAASEPRRVELWYVDQQASLWVDGRRLLVQNFDLPDIGAVVERSPAPLYPRIAIRVGGSPVTLHKVEVDRDIYYSSQRLPRGPNRDKPGTGVLIKSGNLREGKWVHLEADEFFCLGDNSPMSLDGRYWTEINPWIEKRLFEDEGHTQRFGVVPRKLLMGRAFFVYFPAPFALTPESPRLFPNFGDMRFIH